MNPVGIIVRLLDFYGLVIVAYVLLSWFIRGSRGGAVFEVYRALGTVCEPYLGLFRRILPPVMVGSGGIDFTPLVGLVVLQVVSGALARLG